MSGKRKIRKILKNKKIIKKKNILPNFCFIRALIIFLNIFEFCSKNIFEVNNFVNLNLIKIVK